MISSPRSRKSGMGRKRGNRVRRQGAEFGQFGIGGARELDMCARLGKKKTRDFSASDNKGSLTSGRQVL